MLLLIKARTVRKRVASRAIDTQQNFFSRFPAIHPFSFRSPGRTRATTFPPVFPSGPRPRGSSKVLSIFCFFFFRLYPNVYCFCFLSRSFDLDPFRAVSLAGEAAERFVFIALRTSYEGPVYLLRRKKASPLRSVPNRPVGFAAPRDSHDVFPDDPEGPGRRFLYLPVRGRTREMNGNAACLGNRSGRKNVHRGKLISSFDPSWKIHL